MKKFTLLIASAMCGVAAAFMSDAVETVLIKGADGQPLRINATDYNPDVHETVDWQVDDAPAVVTPVAPTGPASLPQMVLAKSGTGAKAKFIVTNTDGAPITDVVGIDTAGYADEPTAWAAITAAITAAGANVAS